MMYQPDFPPVPFRSGLYPVVDSVQWIERLLDAGVRTLQLRIKIGAMKRWRPMSWRQLRWAAAITRDCLSTITGGWRSSIRRMASIWGRKICKPPISMPSARQACGWAFRHMTIWKSTSRWQHAPLISRWDMCSRRKPNRCLLHRRLEQLARHVERLADYPTVAIGGISLARAPAVIATGVGSIAVVSAITQAADWRLATAQLLEIAGVGDE